MRLYCFFFVRFTAGPLTWPFTFITGPTLFVGIRMNIVNYWRIDLCRVSWHIWVGRWEDAAAFSTFSGFPFQLWHCSPNSWRDGMIQIYDGMGDWYGLVWWQIWRWLPVFAPLLSQDWTIERYGMPQPVCLSVARLCICECSLLFFCLFWCVTFFFVLHCFIVGEEGD